jgi:hypothetical protein
MWSRIYLIPMLTAEEDRDLARRHYADLEREQKLLGSQTSAYNSDRYVSPFTFQIDVVKDRERSGWKLVDHTRSFWDLILTDWIDMYALITQLHHKM